ncbi:MAG TPA: hypothetical protein PKV56_09115 [Burkholderiaceae bacterium]|nr:hypothetical protein [Burkholderiaceae bacterium]
MAFLDMIAVVASKEVPERSENLALRNLINQFMNGQISVGRIGSASANTSSLKYILTPRAS